MYNIYKKQRQQKNCSLSSNLRKKFLFILPGKILKSDNINKFDLIKHISVF